MSPIPADAAKAAAPALKKAMGAAVALVTPLVVEVVKPVVPSPDQIRDSAAQLTAAGRLGAKIQRNVQHTADMAARENLSADERALYQEWHKRARRLDDRLQNAKAGSVTKEQLTAIARDREALQADIDSALQ